MGTLNRDNHWCMANSGAVASVTLLSPVFNPHPSGSAVDNLYSMGKIGKLSKSLLNFPDIVLEHQKIQIH